MGLKEHERGIQAGQDFSAETFNHFLQVKIHLVICELYTMFIGFVLMYQFIGTETNVWKTKNSKTVSYRLSSKPYSGGGKFQPLYLSLISRFSITLVPDLSDYVHIQSYRKRVSQKHFENVMLNPLH